MRSIVHDHYGEPREVLQLRNVPGLPAPGVGEVLIRVRFRPIHPGDLIGVRGLYRSSDNTSDVAPGGARPGFDGTGIVEAMGSGVNAKTKLRPGSRVSFFPAKWAWGEYVLAQAQFVTPVPDDIPDAVASQLFVNPLTASMLVRAVEDAGVDAGNPIILTAAGSSVAKLVMTLAQRKGLSVIGLVRSDAGAASLQSDFPDATIVSTEEEAWLVQVRSAIGRKQVRAVLDPVGGPLAGQLIDLICSGGSFIGYGDLSGQPIPVSPLALPVRGLTMKGVSVGSWASLADTLRAADVATTIELARTAPDLFAVAAEYDLSEISKAVVHAEQPGRTGTVLLTST